MAPFSIRNSGASNKPRALQDTAVESCLEQQSLSLADVPPLGKHLIVREVGGLTQGGEPMECFDTVDPAILALSTQTVSAFPGLEWAGVDIAVSEDGHPIVIEINTSSGLVGSHFPWYGKPRPVAEYLFKLRFDRAPLVTHNSPIIPPKRQTPQHVLSARSIARDAKFFLATLMRTRLTKLGWNFSQQNEYLALATRTGHEPVWIQGTATTQDLNVSRRVLNSHLLVRTLLQHAGVPLAPATNYVSLKEAAAHASSTSDESLALHPNKPWDSPRNVRLSTISANLSNNSGTRSPVLAQTIVAGRKFRILATDREVLAALGDADVSEIELNEISTLAVKAVRAIPELRWACVDVVIPDDGESMHALVEGLSTNPIITSRHKLIAGGMNASYKFIIGG